MTVKLSSKYQVVIPENVRSILGLKPGNLIDVICKDNIAFLVPVPTLDVLHNMLKEKISSKNIREKKDRKV